MNITLNQDTVSIAREILVEGKLNGINGKVPPFEECFIESDKVVAKHVLWSDFVKATGCQIPKIFGYIIMDEVFGNCNHKDDNGNLGYRIKLNL